MTRTIVALYPDEAAARKVIAALLEAGFNGDDISLLVRAKNPLKDVENWDVTPGEGFGFGALAGALVGIVMILVPGIGPVIGIGPLAVALTAGIGAATGAITGGLIAALIDLGVDAERAEFYADGLRGGRAVVSLTSKRQWIEWAEKIMSRYEPLDVEHRGGLFSVDSDAFPLSFDRDDSTTNQRLPTVKRRSTPQP